MKIIILCFVIAVSADLADLIYFHFYKADKGFSLFQITSISFKIEYMKTLAGGTLTVLAIAPYFIVLLILKFVDLE
ncbi:hypothetical protein QUF76_11345 [Desulfobacterales bacterium HSG16]|nr:hypothetical protein [Desulfobacterales bacterium HSG16]